MRFNQETNTRLVASGQRQFFRELRFRIGGVGNPVMEMSEGAAVASTPSISTPLQTPTSAPIPLPTATPVPTAAVEEFVTLTQPVPIKIPYGQTILPPGLRLPVISRDAVTVHVHYMVETYAIPIGSTDLR